MTDAIVPAPSATLVLPRLRTPEEVLASFYANRKPTTLRAYKQDLVALAKYLRTDVPGTVKFLLSLDQPSVNQFALGWLDAMEKAELATATRARRFTMLRSFGHRGRAVGILSWEIEIRPPSVQKYRDTRGPTEDQIHRLFAACGEGLIGLRNRVIVGLLFKLALRRFEVCALSLSSYDREGGRLLVLGKGGEEVWIDLPANLRADLDRWLLESGTSGATDPKAPLVRRMSVQDVDGKRIRPDGLNGIVNAIGKRAGIKVWPHAFRHAAITQGFVQGGTVPEMMAVSRHKKPETLMLYNDRVKDVGGRIRRGLDEAFGQEKP